MIYKKLAIGVCSFALILNSTADEEVIDVLPKSGDLLALEKKVQNLEGIIEKMNLQIDYQSKSIQNLEALMDSKKINVINNKKGQQILPTTTDDQEEGFEAVIPESLSKFNEQILKKKYNKAIIGLQKFITKRRNDNDRGAAYYLIAEAYYRQGNKKQAAENYLRSYKNYPDNAMAADSLLKLAIYLSDKKNQESACKLLNRLEFEYPNRSVANKEISQTMLKKLDCTR